jgi:ribose 5-phosphate isomerase B
VSETRDRVAVAADHAAIELKAHVLECLRAQGYAVRDLGGHDPNSADDYPDRAADLGRSILAGEADVGVLLCGSGAGAAIAANKLHGIRAAVCHDTFSAHQSREDDDANVICLGARVVGPGLAVDLVSTFLNARYSGLARHARRLEKVLALERAGTA